MTQQATMPAPEVVETRQTLREALMGLQREIEWVSIPGIDQRVGVQALSAGELSDLKLSIASLGEIKLNPSKGVEDIGDIPVDLQRAVNYDILLVTKGLVDENRQRICGDEDTEFVRSLTNPVATALVEAAHRVNGIGQAAEKAARAELMDKKNPKDSSTPSPGS